MAEEKTGTTTTASEDKTVEKIRKSGTEEVRVSIKKFRKKHYIDLRIYFLNDEGEWKPTKKGISLSTDFISDLKRAVEALETEYKAMEQQAE